MFGDAGGKWDLKKYKRRRDAPTGALHYTPICCSRKSTDMDRDISIHNSCCWPQCLGTLEDGVGHQEVQAAAGCPHRHFCRFFLLKLAQEHRARASAMPLSSTGRSMACERMQA